MLENDLKQEEEEDKEKRVIGLYGEMSLAMALHEKGWQVYKAYIDEHIIDEHIDFIIARYYCTNCKTFSNLEKREKKSKSKKEETKEKKAIEKKRKKKKTFPTDKCHLCHQKTIKFIVRFLQVKASKGISSKKKDIKNYSFHAKLRSNVDKRSFYVWVALIEEKEKTIAHYYIFHHEEVNKFDNLNLDSYQKTDNQKTDLRIDSSGKIVKKGRKYNYDCFNDDFYDNFDKFDEILDEEK